ncbi:MAG: alpha/beta fold hydrolase [Pirellulales bacterium]
MTAAHRIRALFFLHLVVAGMATPSLAQDESAYRQQKNVVYGEAHGVGLLMDIFTPAGSKNGLAIVDVASGAWHSNRGKIVDHKRAGVFRIMTRHGYTVFAVRPGSVSRFDAIDMLEHLRRGVRFVKTHATDYGIDPHRIGLMGASAGGHLACLLAVEGDEDARVRAVAVFFPPTDFLDYGGKMPDLDAKGPIGAVLNRLAFRDGRRELDETEIRRRLERISPARRVTPSTPPFLLIHGDADPLVPLQQSQAMLAALKEAGIPAELIVKPGGGHPWFTIAEEVEVMANWFDRQLIGNRASNPTSGTSP